MSLTITPDQNTLVLNDRVYIAKEVSKGNQCNGCSFISDLSGCYMEGYYTYHYEHKPSNKLHREEVRLCHDTVRIAKNQIIWVYQAK
jgi:hypothetical protein